MYCCTQLATLRKGREEVIQRPISLSRVPVVANIASLQPFQVLSDVSTVSSAFIFSSVNFFNTYTRRLIS